MKESNRFPDCDTAEQQAKVLGVTVDQIRAQYRRNAVGLRDMQRKALASKNGKCNGYTADQLDEMATYSETV